MSNIDNAKERLDAVKDLNAITCATHLEVVDSFGILKDIPVVIKDNVSTRGVLTTASSNILSNYTPVYNATIVDKIINSGGVIIAKSTMDELGMGGFGRTPITGVVLNPRDHTRVSGGSSSGSAALVAAGVVDVSIGTDTGDSMRIPASYCGIVGLKPTYGRVSRYGVIPYASSLDHVGIFANNVKNTALMLEAISGHDPKDHTSSKEVVDTYSDLDSDVSKSNISILDNVIDAIENKDILKGFDDVVSKLKARGLNITNSRLNDELFKSQNLVYQVIANAEAYSNHSNLDGIAYGVRAEGDNLDDIILNSRSQGLGFQVKLRHLMGAYSLSEANYDDVFMQAKKVRQLIVNDIHKHLEDNDFFIAPATGKIAPKIDAVEVSENINDTIASSYMVMDNFSGNPSVVIPMCMVDGMPVGLYISAPAFKEKALLSLAALIEELVGEIQ